MYNQFWLIDHLLKLKIETSSKKMKRYAVLETEINADYNKVFSYIADPRNLPEWALLFEEADENSAIVNFPTGKVKIRLDTKTNDSGVIDWHMHMPDESIAIVQTRVSKLSNGNSLYVFTFDVPPVPDSEVEETLKGQTELVTKELANLRRILA